MLSFCVFKSTHARVQRRRRGAGAARRLGFRVWEFGVYIPVENLARPVVVRFAWRMDSLVEAVSAHPAACVCVGELRREERLRLTRVLRAQITAPPAAGRGGEGGGGWQNARREPLRHLRRRAAPRFHVAPLTALDAGARLVQTGGDGLKLAQRALQLAVRGAPLPALCPALTFLRRCSSPASRSRRAPTRLRSRGATVTWRTRTRGWPPWRGASGERRTRRATTRRPRRLWRTAGWWTPR